MKNLKRLSLIVLSVSVFLSCKSTDSRMNSIAPSEIKATSSGIPEEIIYPNNKSLKEIPQKDQRLLWSFTAENQFTYQFDTSINLTEESLNNFSVKAIWSCIENTKTCTNTGEIYIIQTLQVTYSSESITSEYALAYSEGYWSFADNKGNLFSFRLTNEQELDPNKRYKISGKWLRAGSVPEQYVASEAEIISL